MQKAATVGRLFLWAHRANMTIEQVGSWLNNAQTITFETNNSPKHPQDIGFYFANQQKYLCSHRD
jgi:hypothetical protein